jgi:long-chain acyl-CoA synthetase
MSGGKLVEGYGLSEASPLVSVNPIFGNRKNGTIGVPVADTDARIVDPDTGNVLPDGEVGELSVSGPQVMQGYWNKPEETANVLQDGWLKTGDMAAMDEDGYFTIVDRKKDLILSAGMNIYSREVEEVLYQHPSVQDAAVVGVPSPVRGEVPKAFIVLKEGHELTRRDVIRFCHGKLARFKIPRHVEFRDELPKSAIGKILKRLLKD